MREINIPYQTMDDFMTVVEDEDEFQKLETVVRSEYFMPTPGERDSRSHLASKIVNKLFSSDLSAHLQIRNKKG